MTSRERVRLAISLQQPDRVPIDLGGSVLTGISASAYARLKDYLGLDRDKPRVYDVYQMLAQVEESVRKRFGVDAIALDRLEGPFGLRREGWKPWRMFDGTEVEMPGGFNPVSDGKGGWVILREGKKVAQMPADGYYFDPVDVMPGGAHVDVESYKPHLMSEEELDFLHRRGKALYENTEYAILGAFSPGELFFGMGRGGYDKWMMSLLTEEDWVMALYEKETDAWIENLRLYTAACGEYLEAVVFADDLGTQKGEFISPNLFRNLIAPYYKKVFTWVHEHTELKVFFHSCGSIYHMIPHLIDCGVDVLNPVQCSAANMEPGQLKREFGGKIAFWGGGVDTQKTLPFGTPEEVREEVEERLRILGEGGGYVFAAVHNVQQRTPPENILAAFDTALEAGGYPLE